MTMQEMPTHSPGRNGQLLIYVLDRNSTFTDELCAALRLDGFGAGSAKTFKELESLFRREEPQAVFINANYLEADWPEYITLKLRRRYVPIFLITNDRPEPVWAAHAKRSWVRDVFHHGSSKEDIANAVRMTLPNPVSISDGGDYTTLADFTSLTPRERQTLEHLINGRSSKEIARSMEISPRTIEIHRKNIMKKLSARNIADLVRRVLWPH